MSPPNGSKVVNFLLRPCTIILAITSAVVMASSGECAGATVPSSGAAIVTFTYRRFSAFKLLVGCTITAAILEVVALYVQHFSLSLRGGGGGHAEEKKKKEGEGISVAGILLMVVDDVLLPALGSLRGGGGWLQRSDGQLRALHRAGVARQVPVTGRLRCRRPRRRRQGRAAPIQPARLWLKKF